MTVRRVAHAVRTSMAYRVGKIAPEVPHLSPVQARAILPTLRIIHAIDAQLPRAQNALSMKWLRSIPRFVRLLIGLFLVAQLAGVVSSPRADAQPMPDATAQHNHQHHGHEHDSSGAAHQPGDHGNLADSCCALHAYFAGVMPPAVAVKTAAVVGERLAAGPDDQSGGVPPARLDRPPRPPR
jgi:hypothetical protein